MRIRALAVCAIAALAIDCGGASFFRQYEYEEEIFLSLDGSETVSVNGSIAALDALRGTAFEWQRGAPIERNAVRTYFTSPGVRVTALNQSRRSGRRFVHLRLDVDDITRLGSAPPFAWSTYRFSREGDHFVYRQTIGAAADRDVGNVGWRGRELVAFRLHLPSKIEDQNTGREIVRGNILVWEQPLSDRLRGAPLTLDATMQTQSILYRTLWLFGVTMVAVALVFVAVVWWVLRRGRVVETSLAIK